MKRIVRLVMFLGVAIVAVGVAGVAILTTQDFNAYKSVIAEQVEAVTGRKLTIDGDIHLEVSLSPSIAVEGVSFANAVWGSRAEMVQLDRLAARVHLIPLLSGDVQVEWLELSGVDILLETDAQGAGNWTFDAGVPSSDTSADSGSGGPLPVVKAIRMRDIRLSYVDGVTGASHAARLDQLDLSADGPDTPLNIVAEATFNNEEVGIEGSLGSVESLLDNRMFPINVTLSLLGVEGVLDGTVQSPRDAKGYNIGFSIEGDSLAGSAARAVALGGVGEAPALADSAFVISGALRDDGARVAIDGLKLTVGESDLSGNVSLEPTSPRLALQAALESSRIALGDLIDTQEVDDQPAAPRANDGRVFPYDPLPFDALRGVDAAIKFAGQSVQVDDAAIEDVDVDVALNGGQLIVRPFSLSYLGHALSGMAAIDGSKDIAPVSMSLSGQGIDYGSLLAATTGNDSLKGVLDLNVDVAGQGASVRDIMASLNGDLRVVTQDGRIESSALGFLSGGLLDAIPFLGGNGSANTLECGVIDFTITDGIAAPRALLVETGGLNIVGSGEVDLRDERLNLLFDPRAKNASLVSMAEIGVRVGGTFLEPEIGPDSASVAKNVGKTALTIATGGLSALAEMALGAATNAVDQTDYCQAALSGEMPDEVPEPQAEPASNDAPASQEPAPQEGSGGALDGLGGALNNLFGN